MANIIGLGLRGLEFLWTLLILALVGNMIASAVGGNPSIVNYVMFTAVFSMGSLLYLTAATINEGFVFMPIIPIIVDGANVLFFFVGAVALAAYLGPNSCGNTDYVNSNIVTSGSYDNYKRCHEGQAACAFLWFGFACYVASLVFNITSGSSSGANLRGGAGGIRRGGPSMSQV